MLFEVSITWKGGNKHANISMYFQTVINPMKQGREYSGLVRKIKEEVPHSVITERKLPTDYEVLGTVLGI